MTAAPDFTRNYMRVPRAVYRELLEAGDEVGLHVYLVCLDRVAYVAGPRSIRGHGIVHLEVGELVVGRNELAELLHANPSAIRSALDRLQKRQYIAKRSTKLGTFIRVLGYSAKPDERAIEPPSEQPTNRHQTAKQPPSFRPSERHYLDLRSEKGETANSQGALESPSCPEPLNRPEECAPDRESAIAEVIAFYEDQFARTYGRTAAVVDADRRLVGEVVGELGAAEVCRRIGNMFAASWVASAKTLSFFCRNVDIFAEASPDRATGPKRYRIAAPADDDMPPIALTSKRDARPKPPQPEGGDE